MSAGLNFRIVGVEGIKADHWTTTSTTTTASVTRFGETFTLWQNFKSLRPFFSVNLAKNWLFWFPAIYKKVTTKKGFRALIPRSVCISMPGRLYVCWRAGGACCWCSQTKWLPFQWIILLLLYIEVLSKSKPKTERNYYYYISKFVRFLALN